jgi:cyanophycin synthetase
MFDLSRNFFLLKVIYHLKRLRAQLPFGRAAAQIAEWGREGFYERLWESAATELGARFVPLGRGIIEIRRDDLVTRVFMHHTALADPVTVAMSLDKALVYRLLGREGLPIPRHAAFSLRTLSRAVDFLEAAAGDCVVKPGNGTGGGNGITTGIRTRNQLARAATLAAQSSSDMLIEEQIPGDNYRLLYLDGVLLDAVLRRPPHVTGDGRSTVRQLVEQVNADRLRQGSTRSQVLLTIDLDMRHTLARQELSLASVPAAGAVVVVKTVINQNFAADNVTVTDRVCPAVVEAGARAARCVGVRLAGIDVITRDPTRPLEETGGVILEVNDPPGFQYHYHKNDGSYPVAVRVLEQLFADLEGSPAREYLCAAPD